VHTGGRASSCPGSSRESAGAGSAEQRSNQAHRCPRTGPACSAPIEDRAPGGTAPARGLPASDGSQPGSLRCGGPPVHSRCPPAGRWITKRGACCQRGAEDSDWTTGDRGDRQHVPQAPGYTTTCSVGVTNFAVDRAAAEQAAALVGGMDRIRSEVRANRALLGRGGALCDPRRRHPPVPRHRHRHPQRRQRALQADFRDPEDIVDRASAQIDFTQPVVDAAERWRAPVRISHGAQVVAMKVGGSSPLGHPSEQWRWVSDRTTSRVPSGQHRATTHPIGLLGPAFVWRGHGDARSRGASCSSGRSMTGNTR
jgi:hypothetical protein